MTTNNPAFEFEQAEQIREQGLHLYRVKMADEGWIELLAHNRNEAITMAEERYPEDWPIIALPRDREMCRRQAKPNPTEVNNDQ